MDANVTMASSGYATRVCVYVSVCVCVCVCVYVSECVCVYFYISSSVWLCKLGVSLCLLVSCVGRRVIYGCNFLVEISTLDWRWIIIVLHGTKYYIHTYREREREGE